MSSYITERRQEEKDRRRTEIVEAAEALYKELGWDAVTMDSVAKRARLSRALVYVYFKDKQDLHFAIAARALETLQRRFEEATARAKTGISLLLRCLCSARASRPGRERPKRARARLHADRSARA
jgi:AcrR family transcriptional regulator